MMWVDVLATYLFGLKFIVLALAMAMLIFGLDDLFVDVSYWCRRLWRMLVIYRRHDRAAANDLYEREEQPIAILVPAWQEAGVIRSMAAAAAHTLDYENYHIFIGTYPNDAETQAEVDEVAARYPNVHKVVTARPGPTSKADCLNNVLAAILEFEQKARVEFAGFVLHDAEDVVSALELRVFNMLLPRKDLIQLPVYPLLRHWYQFTAGHYVDEFAEHHGKEVVMREALAGQVPSAGVGTCFSRRAIVHLMREHDGMAFDVRSLTEDYDIGFRLKRAGMEEIFVRFPVAESDDSDDEILPVVCVREYFPTGFKSAVKQKSRWILGIVFQGWRSNPRGEGFWVNYFLWRDRRGAIAHVCAFLATLVFVQLLALLAYGWWHDDAYRFVSVFADDPGLRLLLLANLFLLGNRAIQRVYFVSSYYGLFEGLLSLPRMVWSNIVNFCANARAAWRFFTAADVRSLSWDKTDHDFPVMAGSSRTALGEILVAQGALSDSELERGLLERRVGERLGQSLLRLGLINGGQLAAGLAEQGGLEATRVDHESLDGELIAQMPQALALKYGVLPIGQDGKRLIIACEAVLPPVAHAALERRLKRPVIARVAAPGSVTVGLRHWYARQRSAGNPHDRLSKLVEQDVLSEAQAEAVWQDYVSRQRLLGDVLLEIDLLEPAVMSQALIGYERSDKPFGQYLLEQDLISQQALDQALRRQREEQPGIEQVLAEHGIRLNGEEDNHAPH